ncbi:hypothetical protein [Methyloversatilis discipulorum]|nr:hypothetical protein [Methyloversatilis discipulorum]
MGAETQYIAEIEEPCHNCDQEIRLEFEVWEYPDGIINYTNEKSEGAEILDDRFSIEHKPDKDDGIIEAVKLAKPLLQFRFDKFSEQFVDFWISRYRKDAKTTTVVSAASIFVAAVALGISIYNSEQTRKSNQAKTQDFKEQYLLLRTTQENLTDLEAFILSKKQEISVTQDLLNKLQEQKAEIEPIVTANQEVVNALFAQQRKEMEKGLWLERGISFALGVLASLIASVIWHFVGRLKKRDEEN